MTKIDDEELTNIMCAMICMKFEVEVFNICLAINAIDDEIKRMLKELNIPQISDHEFLDIILRSMSRIYKLYNQTPKDKVTMFSEFVEKLKDE